jgi:transposase
MQFKNFIGIDLSKINIDLHLIEIDSNSSYLGKCKNESKAISLYLKKLFKMKKLSIDETLICAEHTGIYSKHLEDVCVKLGYKLWMENPRKIKYSVGMSRGKSDPVDSFRIADYAKRHNDKSVVFKAKKKIFLELETLTSARETVLQFKNQISVQIKECEKFSTLQADILKEAFKEPLEATSLKLKHLNKQIDAKIKEYESIEKSISLITSIPGVGRETALGLVLSTANFELFDSAEQMACYAGVAPFVHQSGSSVKGRTRVSNSANKGIKTLLHMAALCAMRYNQDLKKYYIRKVKEGKNKMSVLNALRNKLLHRIFAIIKRGTPYVNELREEFSVRPENSKIVLAI